MKTQIRFNISITGKQFSYLLFWHRHLLTYKPIIEPILAILSDSSLPRESLVMLFGQSTGRNDY